MDWPDLQLEHLAAAVAFCHFAFGLLAWSRSDRIVGEEIRCDPGWRWLAGASFLGALELGLWLALTQVQLVHWHWWAQVLFAGLACAQGVAAGLAGLHWWGFPLTRFARWAVLLVGIFTGAMLPGMAHGLLGVGWLILAGAIVLGERSGLTSPTRRIVGLLITVTGIARVLRPELTGLMLNQPSELPMRWTQPELGLFLLQGSAIMLAAIPLLATTWRRRWPWLLPTALVPLAVLALAWREAAAHRAADEAAWEEQETFGRRLWPLARGLRAALDDQTRPVYAQLIPLLDEAEKAGTPVRHYWLWALQDGTVFHLLDSGSLGDKPHVQRTPPGYAYRQLPNLALRATRNQRFESGPYFVAGERRVGRNVALGTTANQGHIWLQSSVRYEDWKNRYCDPRVPAAIGLLYGLGLCTLAASVSHWYRDSQALQARMAAATASAQARVLMAGFVSHELRTPLQIILGRVEQLQNLPQAPGTAGAYREIATQSQLLLDLVKDTLDLCSLEANSMPLRPVQFSPASLLTTVAEEIRPAAAARGLVLDYEIDTSLPPHAVADAQRLRQILTNLLTNAVRYTPAGSVRLEARWEPDEPGRLVVKVSDTGPGLPAEVLNGLGIPFQPGGNGGTGLGLALVKRLTKHLGGDFTASNPAAGGCLMTLKIPLTRIMSDPAAAGPTPLVALQGGLAGLRVILAEDNLPLREVLVAHLHYMGAEVLAFGNAREVIEACRQGAFDAALLDVMLPGLSGREAARLLAQATHRPRLIVGLSAQNLSPAEARADGFDEYLQKPVERGQLFGVLAPLSGARQPAGAAAPMAVDEPSPRVLELFRAEAPAQLARLRGAVEAGDLESVQRLAHHLQGSAYAVRDENLRLACAALTKWVVSGEGSGPDLLGRLEAALARWLQP